MPPAERAPVKYKYYLNILATNLDSLIVNWAGNEFFVTKEFLEQELAKKADHTNLSLLTENKNLPDAINEVFQIINDKSLSFRGTITDEATFNEATKTGWYKVKNYRINNMYGFGILYVTKHEQTTLQIFYSHREGIAYRQDWDGNIRSATWTKIGESDLYKLTENFDPNLLYLNDAGTKNVDKVYFDRNRKGLFLCIKQTTGTVNSAQNFVDISNKANYDRFKSLNSIEVILWEGNITSSEEIIQLSESYKNFRNIRLIGIVELPSGEGNVICVNEFPIDVISTEKIFFYVHGENGYELKAASNTSFVINQLYKIKLKKIIGRKI